MHFGIDYGSKLAGTTVITYDINGALYQRSSVKKEDADEMVQKLAMELRPKAIYLDAPLSLPNAYFGKGKDYFYRKSDKELKAMSPMFLGGLTARAMKLKVQLESIGITVYETYPGALIRTTPELNKRYSKKDLSLISEVLKQIKILVGDVMIEETPKNIHQIDSLLAWISGNRHQKGVAQLIGDPEEGVIIY